MNQIIPASFGAPSARFAGVTPTDDLSSGIQSSYGLIGYKGKVWSIKYRGEEKILMRDDGDGPANSIPVVILKASKHVSKIWYENGYVEGSTAAPDCFSNDGIAPEATSAKRQCDTCALCPHNAWGSRTTPAGKAGKSCADSKRLAVVPLADLNNEAYGGPMLLRVPAASLQGVADYGGKMQQMGYPYYSIATKISFDPEEAFPKFVFSGIRPLSDEEADVVIALRDGHNVQRVLAESEFGQQVAPATPAQDTPLFEQSDAGARTQSGSAPAGVGDQARAAAAQQAANHGQQAQGAQTPAAKKTVAPVEPVKKAGPQTNTQPSQADIEAEIEARIRAETEQRIREEYAAKAKAQVQQTAQPAAKAEAPVEQAVTTQVTEDASPNVATASDFEASLDDMLDGLLPK